MINIIVKYCGARFFSLQLPGYSLLMFDFLHAANAVLSSDMKGVTLDTFNILLDLPSFKTKQKTIIVDVIANNVIFIFDLRHRE